MTNQKILLDSNFIVGLYATTDSLHKKALILSRSLNSSSYQLFISNYVISEVITVLSQRAGKKFALNAGKQLFDQQLFTTIQQTKKQDQLTWDLFQTIDSKNTSFVDCSLITTAKSEGIKLIFTFDKNLQSLAQKHHLKVNI